MEKGGGIDMRRDLIIVGIVVVALLMSGCATMSPRTKRGAGIGGVLGGAAGAVIDDENRWRGGIIGATVGALIGGTIGNMMDEASYEAAEKDKEVQYSRHTEDGSKEVVRATPYGYTADGDYKLIKTQVIRDGVVVKEEVRRVPVY
jgi:uncharacterized protein YceK